MEKQKSKSATDKERKTNKNIEQEIIKLGQKGVSPSKIGAILKKEHKIPKAKLAGYKITKILEKNNISYENDLSKVKKKIEKLDKHFEKNKQDYSAKKALITMKARRHKLGKYYKKNK